MVLQYQARVMGLIIVLPVIVSILLVLSLATGCMFWLRHYIHILACCVFILLSHVALCYWIVHLALLRIIFSFFTPTIVILSRRFQVFHTACNTTLTSDFLKLVMLDTIWYIKTKEFLLKHQYPTPVL